MRTLFATKDPANKVRKKAVGTHRLFLFTAWGQHVRMAGKFPQGGVVRFLKTFFPLFLLLIFLSSTASAIDFYSHGYYRNRVEFTYNLDTQKPNTNPTYDNNRFGVISFNQMRLRVEPLLKLNDFLSIHSQFDILDDVVYGSSDTKELEIQSPVVGTVALPAGAGSLSMVGGAGGENGSINVRRVWGQILTPIGQLKFGRQPSNWGLGIFQNDGNGRQDDFGDTADRILFITQKQFDDGGAISIGALWDIAFEAQFDPRIQGLGGEVRDNGQDTNQWAGIVYYERPNLGFGLFGGMRKRDGGNSTTTTALPLSSAGVLSSTAVACGIDGDTLVYFLDAYGKYSYLMYNLGFEFVYIGGQMTTGVAIDAIPWPNFYPGGTTAGIIQLPARQDVRIFMAAFEANARYKWGGEWELKSGFAQGDANPLSQRITQYGFRPDYQIALLMFHVPLGTSPALRSSSTGTLLAGHQPITGNFVNNAIYVTGGYKHHFDFGSSCKNCNDFSTGLKVITAFANKPPVKLDFQTIEGASGQPTLPSIESIGKWYGIEADILIEGKFFDHLYAALEGGILIPGSAYDIDLRTPIDPNGMLATISPDKAKMAYAMRLTAMLEF